MTIFIIWLKSYKVINLFSEFLSDVVLKRLHLLFAVVMVDRANLLDAESSVNIVRCSSVADFQPA